MKIHNTSDEKHEMRITGMYQGGAMSGKTYCACTWPDCVMIAFDADSLTMAKFPNLTVIHPDSFREFKDEIVPHVKHRTMHELVGKPVQTVVWDTASVASQWLQRELQGTRDKMTQGGWGVLLQDMTSVVLDMTSAKLPAEDQPSYNIIINVHLKRETDEAGTLTGLVPAIPGQFAGNIARMVDFAFLCEKRVELETVSGQPARKTVRYFIRTQPPSDLYTIGDRLVGANVNGVVLKELPVETGGTYPELCEAWGLTPSPTEDDTGTESAATDASAS